MSSTVSLNGSPVQLEGIFPATGTVAPAFSLVRKDLTDVTLDSFGKKRKILNIFPSIDTDTCAMSVRKFNELASQLPATAVLCISADLPFAQKRFCGAEGLKNVIPLSTMRNKDFAASYGVAITSGPLAGLTTRAIIVLDSDNNVCHTELVSDIKNEPDYDAALAALK